MGAHKAEVRLIHSPSELEKAHTIRNEVFVIGQGVPAEEEIDEYESQCRHFLATIDNVPVGAARWRFTDTGIKLERFAVLEPYRSHGIGSALLQAVLDDIKQHPKAADKLLYLHSQVTAMGLYSKFGFKQTGPLFKECDIEHYKMIRNT